MLLGVTTPHVRPEGVLSVNRIVPAKPFNGLIVIVDCAEDPGGTDAGEVAVIAKSRNSSMTVVECVSDPLVPVTVRVKVPAVLVLHDTVAVPEPVRLLGVMEPHVRPEARLAARLTIPVNPFFPVTVIVMGAD